MSFTNNEVFDYLWSKNMTSPAYKLSTAFLLELYENCDPGGYWVRYSPGTVSVGNFISALFYKYENIKIAVICHYFYNDIIADVWNNYDSGEISFDSNSNDPKVFFPGTFDSKFAKFFLYHNLPTSEVFDLVVNVQHLSSYVAAKNIPSTKHIFLSYWVLSTEPNIKKINLTDIL